MVNQLKLWLGLSLEEGPKNHFDKTHTQTNLSYYMMLDVSK